MKAVWQTILDQHRHGPLNFWLGILVALVPAVAGLLLLGVSGWFITAAAMAGITGAVLNIFAPSAIIRALAIGRTAGRYGERVLTHDATFRFLTHLRNTVFAAFAREGVNGRRSGTVLNRLTRDIAALDTIYLRLAVPLALAAAVSLCLLIVWSRISGVLLLTGTVFLALWAALALAAFLRADRKNARRADAAAEAMSLRAADLASGRRDLAVYGGLEQAAAAIGAAGDRLVAADDALEVEASRLDCASSFIGQVFLAVTLVVCAWGVIGATLSPALAVGLVLVVIAVPELMAMALPGLSKLPRTALSAARSQRLRAGPAMQAEEPVAARHQKAGVAVPVLRFDAVTFRYPGARQDTVSALSFEIAPQEVLAVAGRSGCGKSTLAALAARLRMPDRGAVLLNGGDLRNFGERDLRARVTVLGQRPYLFNDTVAANLRIADPQALNAALWAALEQARLAERIAASPAGLETVLGEGGLGLSGGEQRRLALARAFLTRPDLFILDEMTEGLDADTSADVLERFRAFRGRAAVLMIAHKKLELDAADRIMHLPDLKGPDLGGKGSCIR